MPRSKDLNKPKRQADYTPPSKRKPKAAIYVRVSTHHQIDRESLPFQRQELENYARYVLNLEDWEIFEDAGYSAKSTDRPRYQEMMTRIRRGEFTHLLVWKLDRISRNLRDFTELWDELKEHGVTFVSKMEQFDTGTAMGEAMLRIILVFAELERKLTAERVFGIMMARAQKGQWNGAPVPLGYDWDGENRTIKVNEEEAELVRLIYSLYEEKLSSQLVADWLCRTGRQTKRGGTWGSKTVTDILRNPIYTGIYRWNYRRSGRGERKADEEVVTVDQAVPAIVPREQWERVQQLLDANYKGRRTTQRRARHPHMLSGLIRCAYCGQTYLAHRSTRPYRGGYHPSIYRCGTYVRNMQCPNNRSIPGTYIETFVLEYLRAYVRAARIRKVNLGEEILKVFGRPEIEHVEIEDAGAGLTGVMAGMVEIAAGRKKEAAVDDKLEALKGQKQRIERAIARLDDAYFFAEEGPSAISKAEYLVKRADLIEKLRKIDEEIAALGKEKPAAALDVELLSRFLLVHNLYAAGSIREALPHLDPLVMQDFLQQVIRYVEAADGWVTRIAFNGPGGEVVHRFVYRESP